MLLLVIVGLVISVYLYLKWANGYWTRRGIFQIEPDLLFGNIKKIIFKQVPFTNAVLDHYKILKQAKVKHGGMYIFTIPVYIPMDPAIIKNIFQKDFNHFVNRGTYHTSQDILSNNLVNMTDDKWKGLRTKVTPAFTSGKLKMMFGTLIEKTVGLEKVMQEFADSGKSCEIKDILARYTTDVIGSCGFGIECNSLDEPDNAFRIFGKKIFEPKRARFVLISFVPWSVLGFFNYKEDGEDVYNFFSNIVKDTIKYRETNKIFRKDFMHMMLQLKNIGKTTDTDKIFDENAKQNGLETLTENEVLTQCFVFFAGGFETSSTVMTFALLELARNQDIQDKLREEIETVLNKHEGKITYESVQDMEYLDKVIQETLRKYPPITALPRICNKKYQIPGSDLVIEKGARVEVPVWGLHLDPEYYPNPEQFNPENFSAENKAKRPDYTFLPFGEGPRMCIGLRFGMLQSKVGLLTLIRKFKLSLSKKTALPVEMEHGVTVLTVKGGVWLDVKNI